MPLLLLFPLHEVTGCWGPLMDRNLVVRSESEREKEADIPWFTQRTNKVLDTGLASLTKAPDTLSRGS